MSPPTLPYRQIHRPTEAVADADTAVNIQQDEPTTKSTGPPQLPPRIVKPLGSLNAKKVEQVVEPHAKVPDDEEDITTLPTTSPPPPPPPTQTPRFVAPAPAPGSTTNNPLQKILQPLLHLLALNPTDTPTDALLRKQLEEEQISRYMGSFSRHVQYLRMDGAGAGAGAAQQQEQQKMEGSGKEILQRPDKEKYRTRMTRTVSPPVTVTDGIDEPLPLSPITHIVVADEPTGISAADQPEGVQSGGGMAGDIDWFGYYAAVRAFLLPFIDSRKNPGR
ncbi:hypothetical protein QFC22_001995 [Naganishia vaughanmartiniae]|uniref:Uncharacterized protein n=1 Tax=Naganishia vaughanmartiniae TaxID=1424756 RepID=A0ACC2XGP7_9TREE|nr:hypothetical protein QFC22_001995 [Naganishia vaughanmartiniae]